MVGYSLVVTGLDVVLDDIAAIEGTTQDTMARWGVVSSGRQ